MGDYVDRGYHNLELVCLLFSLKIQFPSRVYLLRGNHEDSQINQVYGFYKECMTRISGEDHFKEQVYRSVNQLFEWLPLGAVIDEKILCVHGGIGEHFTQIARLEALQRPLKVSFNPETQHQKVLLDVLWSDPSHDPKILGYTHNTQRDPFKTGQFVYFGIDMLEKFVKANGIQTVIRAHECVMGGFLVWGDEKLVTVFSATDYCGKHKNAGAIIYLTNNSSLMQFKVIYPSLQNQNWIPEGQIKKPTPPRWNVSPVKNY